MTQTTPNGEAVPQKRGFGQVLKSYFYWNYERGTIHYDVMVSLILLFIFVTPQFWDFGARPTLITGATHALQLVGSGRGVIVTVQAADVEIPQGASHSEVKFILRKAIEPVTGDAVYVERWEGIYDTQGKLTAWRVWAHR